jgi:hypothetical protein
MAGLRTENPHMAAIAAILIFFLVMLVLNLIEFGRLD